MATSPDHPELQFVQASGYTSGRPDGPPLWVVIHDMEASETPTTAEHTAQYFATGAGGRDVSSHYCADDTSVVQCVLLKDVAWTVGNRPGNNRGINWELSGFASQTREQWLDPFGVAMFGQIASVIRADAAKFGIPLRRCTIDDLKAFRPGITSHNDLGVAFGGTDHTDPGPNFPWDYLLALLTGGAMANPYTMDNLDRFMSAALTMSPMVTKVKNVQGVESEYPNPYYTILQAIKAGGGVGSGPVTPEQLAELTAAAHDGAKAGAVEAAPAIVGAVDPVVRDAIADGLEGGAEKVREGA